jgi:uncharacterized protein (DUF2147 family)
MTLLIFAALMAAPPASADTVVGKWRTETHNAIVEISHCGPTICAKILTSDMLRTNPGMKDVRNENAALRNRPLLGLSMFSGFKPAADGVWDSGSVYNADDGKTYSGKVTPVGNDQLKLRGCVFFPLCKTQTWTRVH